MPGRRLRLSERRSVPKVTLPISHEAKVTTTESWSVWPQSHSLRTLLYLAAAGERGRWGEEGSLYSKVRGLCTPQAKGFRPVLSPCDRDPQRAADGACWEQLQVQGVKGEEDNRCFL